MLNVKIINQKHVVNNVEPGQIRKSLINENEYVLIVKHSDESDEKILYNAVILTNAQRKNFVERFELMYVIGVSEDTIINDYPVIVNQGELIIKDK